MRACLVLNFERPAICVFVELLECHIFEWRKCFLFHLNLGAVAGKISELIRYDDYAVDDIEDAIDIDIYGDLTN